jgi:hypothetical protein
MGGNTFCPCRLCANVSPSGHDPGGGPGSGPYAIVCGCPLVGVLVKLEGLWELAQISYSVPAASV